MRTLYIIVTGVFLLFLSCQKESQSPKSNELSIHFSNSPNGLNPLSYLSSPELTIESLMFPNLADYNPKTLVYEPVLIKSLPNVSKITEGKYAGKLSYEMELREDLKWDDGQAATGEDYLFTIKVILHPLSQSTKLRSYFSSLVDVEVDKINKKKFRVILDGYTLAGAELVSNFKIIQRSFYDKNNVLGNYTIPQIKAMSVDDAENKAYFDKFNSTKYSRDTFSGLGAYKLEQWVDKQFIHLKRKDKYWASASKSLLLKAKPNDIFFYFTPDVANAKAQLQAGKFDIYPNIQTQDFERYKSDPYFKDYEFKTVKTLRYYYLPLNTQHKILKEKKVRQALAYLVPTDTIIKYYENGMGERINSPFLHIDPISQLKDVDYSPEKAKLLLTEAGWKDSNQDGTLDKRINNKVEDLELNILTSGSELGQLISGLIKQSAEKVGMKINIEKATSSVIRKRLLTKEFDISIGVKGLSLAPYDPYPLLHTDNSKAGKGNLSGFGNTFSDALIDTIRSTTDEKLRTESYLELERILQEEQALIFLYAPVMKLAVSKSWNGVISPKRPGYAINTFTLKNNNK